jgi:hypothetical protein
MSGWEWLYYVAVAATAASYYVDARNTEEMEEERRRSLNLDQRNAELQAKAEEVARLEELYYANSDVIARASGVDAYASPSLTAIRQFNFRVAQRDIENINLNLLGQRAGTQSMIRISKMTQRTARTTGMLNAFGTLAGGMATGQQTFGTFTKKPASQMQKMGGKGQFTQGLT